ncbi:MAG: thioesterase family protein, partial [Rikenellaceae bacterium]|nr:thioesterase family protein [Rikenellaceae bacterium]
MELKTGLEYVADLTVGEGNTAAAMGSGDMQVLATPSMVALMENAAMNCVAGHLPEGSTTVGTQIDVSHSRATPAGVVVYAKAVLESVEGRKLVFSVSARDDKGTVGEGSHTRVVVDR